MVEYKIIPYTCPCCNKCWIYIEGPRKGCCIHGGPYKGYVYVGKQGDEIK